MSLRNCISDMASKIGTCVLEAMGETASYSNRGAAGVSIYGSSSRRTVQRGVEGNADLELITMEFMVPKQTNFPPDNDDEGGDISIDDTITLNGVVFYIQSFTQDSAKATYTLNLENEEARRLKG